MLFPNNAQIRVVSRMGSFDRYGQGRPETVYSVIWGRIDFSLRHAKDANGDTVTISATLTLPAQYELLPKDEIELESPRKDKYLVFDVTENRDLLGVVAHREYRLVKQVQGLE